MSIIDDLEAKHQARLAPFRAKYPELFSKLKWLEIEDGWSDILHSLCESITQYVDMHVPDELKDQIYFDEIKQKFGGLRVHLNQYVPYIQGAISAAQNMSLRICEKCGNHGAGRQNVRGWITTLCPTHYKEAMEKKL